MKIKLRDKIISIHLKNFKNNKLGESTLSPPYDIDLKPNLEDDELFDVFLHECLHQILPDYEEDAIEEISMHLTEAFYKIFDVDIAMKPKVEEKLKEQMKRKKNKWKKKGRMKQ